MFISSSRLDEKNLVLHKRCSHRTIICNKSAEDMTRSVSSSKKISVDKNKRRESLIQSEEIDEKEHAVFLYHIDSMKEFVHWLLKMLKS